MVEIAVGSIIEDQKVLLHDDNITTLKNLLGDKNFLVVYFYPRDNTPGCTKEACSIRDNFDDIKKKANIVGVSSDSAKSHVKFINKYSLPFSLISDSGLNLTKTFGAYGKKRTGGMGLIRSTFVLDKDLKIQSIFGLKGFPKVTTNAHADEILNVL
ncbi:MAG: putative peroxiredoxin bcp [Candidatus Heimdallarchaeota archaeon LC_3]|nr:MAG: putative peroxiredoxin bcp [Candidatus Heimdallarchaeota archaeon LC_3]